MIFFISGIVRLSNLKVSLDEKGATLGSPSGV